MQIEVDFEVVKALVAKLEHEGDTYNEVIRRLLGLSAAEAPRFGEIDLPGQPDVVATFGAPTGGVWFSGVFFPDGTRFRATYKGRTFRAWIQNSSLIDEFGNIRTSPSQAASAITNTNVNGWRFWFVRRPHDEDWLRMDALKP